MATKEEREWISARNPEGNRARTAALAKVPGQYNHPTAQGLFMRVSPKGKAVYAFKFRDLQQEIVSGKLGTVAETGSREIDAVTLEEAIATYEAKRRYHKSKTVAGVLTVGIAFADWLKEPKRGGDAKSPVTLSKYRTWYDHYLKKTCDAWPLETATPKEWLAVLHICKESSPHETRALYWVINGVYKHFKELKLVRDNPVDTRVFKNNFAGKDTRTKRKSQVAAIDLGAFVNGIFAIRGQRNESRRALMLLLLQGWRVSGVLQIRWDRIDFKNGTYEVKQFDRGWKGYVGLMAINTYAKGYLLERKADGGDLVSEYVFPSPHSNAAKPYRADLRWAIKSAAKLLGYHVIPHDLRRTFATIGEVVLDGNLRMVGLLMGHKQLQLRKPDAGTQVDEDYLVRNMASEVVCSTRVAEAILEIAGAFPLSEEIESKFRDWGIDIKQKLPLIELEDDDTPGVSGEAVADEGKEEEESALAMAETAIAVARRPRKSKNI